MRKLSFKGYLRILFGELSGRETGSLYRLCALSKQNARLKAAVALYLQLYTTPALRAKLEKRFPETARALTALGGVTEENMAERLEAPELSEYANLYRNYLYRLNAHVHEDGIKKKMHQKIRDYQAEKSITNYRIYTALSLNHGNVNAFLKYGDVSKLSLSCVRNILAYVKEA